MVFVSQVTLQDHVIKALDNYIARSPSRYVTILLSLVAICVLVVEI